jgi:hypothetical protein
MGALVETAEGPRPIEDIVEGDEVLSASLDDGLDVESGAVVRTYKSIEPWYLVINGGLRVTGSHPFHVERGWVRADDLKVGDKFFGAAGKRIDVSSVERVNRFVRVYNLEVGGTHTFFVDGIMVHNKGPDPEG